MNLLLASSFLVGLVHALAGPDHYIPFIAMAEAGKWSRLKTLSLASFASLLHVGSSIVIGIAGIGAGKQLLHLARIESVRGTLGGYLLMIVGGIYTLYALYKHRRPHIHNGLPPANTAKTMAGWTLFSIFVLGPCEPLIPLMFAVLPFGIPGIIGICLVFTLTTLLAVNAAVIFGTSTLKPIAARFSHSFAHLAGGIAILITGITIQFI